LYLISSKYVALELQPVWEVQETIPGHLIFHFCRNLGVNNIATGTQRISVDLRASGDAVKPNQRD
jgi:hypothetical protein